MVRGHFPNKRIATAAKLLSARWSVLIGIIVAIAAETVFMTIVTFTGIKDLVSHVFLDIGFERPVLRRP